MDDTVRRWAAARLGPLEPVEAHGPSRGPWTVCGGRYVVKTLGPGRAWEQALRAYEQVVPLLGEAGVPVPTLVDADPETRTLLLTVVLGSTATLASPPPVFEAAGRAIALLHGLPCPSVDRMPLEDALLARARALPDHEAVLARLEAVRPGGARVWCHRDVQPQNWVGGGLVDFEHGRPDHPLVDWVRLEARGWTPAQRSAFVSGYGSEPDPDVLGAMLGLYGLQTVTWARSHGDAHLLAIGEAALDRALAPAGSIAQSPGRACR